MLRSLEPNLRQIRDAIWTQAQRLLELHGELEMVWETGHTTRGEEVGNHADRRAWLLGQLSNTTEDQNGAAVRARVRAFIESQVQSSAYPFEPDVWPIPQEVSR